MRDCLKDLEAGRLPCLVLLDAFQDSPQKPTKLKREEMLNIGERHGLLVIEATMLRDQYQIFYNVEIGVKMMVADIERICTVEIRQAEEDKHQNLEL